MEKTVSEYFSHLSPQTKARLIQHFSVEVEEFGILISSMLQTLQNYHHFNPVYDENDPKHIAYGLMTKGGNTLMAAFELALNGYLWESPILLRSALEGFATAWDIVHNEKRFSLWKNNKKFDSTDSIKNVKEIIEPVGKLNGFLSNMFVHTNPMNASPSFVISQDEPKLQFFGFIREGKESIRTGQVYFSLFAAYVFLQLTELTFHQYSLALETIEKIPDTDTVRTRVSERHSKFVKAMVQHYESVLKDPSGCY